MAPIASIILPISAARSLRRSIQFTFALLLQPDRRHSALPTDSANLPDPKGLSLDQRQVWASIAKPAILGTLDSQIV